jgi:hypothetical protein
MDPEIGPVRAQLFGGDGQVDGLQERVRGRAGLRFATTATNARRREIRFSSYGQSIDAGRGLRSSMCSMGKRFAALCVLEAGITAHSLTFGNRNVEPVEGCRNEAVQTNEIDELIGAVLTEGADR